MKRIIALFAFLLLSPAWGQSLGPVASSGGGGGGTPCTVTAGSLQYNNSGAFGCVTDWTTGGTSDLTGASGATIAVNGATIGTNKFAVLGKAGFGVGNLSAGTIFGTTGYNIVQPTGTDTDTASSGTIASTYVNLFGARTLASSSATTLTTASNAFIDSPVAGTNITLTNSFSLILNSPVSGGGSGDTLGMYLPGNSSGRRGWAFGNQGITGMKFARWADSLGGATATIWHIDNSITTDTFTIDTGSVVLSAPTDAAHTDATLCRDTTSGEVLAGSGTLGICLGTSGRQFKTEFKPMTAGLDEIMKLKLWNYHYKPGYGDNGKRVQYGPTAQDVEQVRPDLVGYNEKGEAINYDIGAFIPIALHAIQQLKADNDDLRARILALSNSRH